jgi:molybdenum cofactor cytidylyltransferase
MSAAPGADPELLRSPGRTGLRIAEVHGRLATLAAKLERRFGHVADCTTEESCKFEVIRLTSRGVQEGQVGSGDSGGQGSSMVVALILAGGASTRMGSPKALLTAGGETFVARLVRVARAAGADDVVVVTGTHDAEIREELARAPLTAVRVATNPAPEGGQISSLVAGLDVVDRPGVAAVLVMLVDHPFVSETTVAALLAAWRTTRAPVVRPRYAGRGGHPVVFDRAAFGVLRSRPEGGARAVLRHFGPAVLAVDVEDEGVRLDIDTVEDYRRALGRPPAL